jgi:isoaspartyl peptidase/L-asparaginase-like protein (Ntn-hydrolase superfamily)
VKKLGDTINGSGGVIAIDKNGEFGIDFNTKVMVWASIKDNTLEFGMEKNERRENISETEQL